MSSVEKTRHAVPKPVYSFRRDTLPPLLGVLTFILTLAFLNFQVLYTQIQYRAAAGAPLPVVALDTTSPEATARPNEVPSIWIPKIDVRAPIIFEPSTSSQAVQTALRNGVVHYGDTVNPGEVGNAVLFGHSSGLPWTPGNYKFVFTLLNKLVKEDQIVVDYEGTRYVYVVTGSIIVDPRQVKVLETTPTPTLTLITCTPIGTSAKRLVVTAKQVSPKPQSTQTYVAAAPKLTAPEKLPSDSPSIWRSILNLFWH